MVNECYVKTLSASGLIFSGSGHLDGYLVGTDGVNDVTVEVFNAEAAAGNELVPTVTYDAAKLGLNGFFARRPISVIGGCYIQITCAGTCEVFAYVS